jgi:hypothetical protein
MAAQFSCNKNKTRISVYILMKNRRISISTSVLITNVCV